MLLSTRSFYLLFFKNKNSIKLWIAGFVAVTLGLLLSLPLSPVLAHQSPALCNANRFNTSIIKDRTEVYQGQTLTYTVTASNLSAGADLACDITNATISIRLPAADGTPTGTVVTLGTNLNFPANTPVTDMGSTPYVVNVNPGVTDIVAEVRGDGDLHDAPTDHSALIIKTIGTSVVAAPSSSPGGGSSGSSSGGSSATAASSASAADQLPRLPNTGTASQL